MMVPMIKASVIVTGLLVSPIGKSSKELHVTTPVGCHRKPFSSRSQYRKMV